MHCCRTGPGHQPITPRPPLRVQVHIPRPPAPGTPPPPGLGKVLIEFVDPTAAMQARNAMHGRRFGGRTVTAQLLTDEEYKGMQWD